MPPPAPPDRDLAALQARLARLAAASRRINASLDFDQVLQGVLDAARTLAGARYGVMTVLDDDAQVQAFLSSGLTTAQAEQLWRLPDGLRIFAALTGAAEPLRVPDLVAYLRAQGFTAFTIPLPVGVFRFMAAPLCHRDVRVGHVFVGDKAGGAEFSRADEETLVLFAAQAALVIANARTHRAERRARADLETLVQTAPVGVVVLDARTGRPVSVNREARRLVAGLLDDGQDAADLLDVVTCVRGDGREIALRTFPLAELLSAGETVRAEEIALQVPDGRRISALLNATPIRAEDGRPASVVVTLQDLAPLEDQERLRAEFLAMVSHELRTPLAAVKGAITTLLEAAPDLDPAEMTQFFHIIRDQSDQMRALIGDLLDVASIETGALAVDPEPSAVQSLVDEATGRLLPGGAGHVVTVDLAPDLPLVMADRRRIVQVLNNLLANAAGYAPDGSPILVNAVRDGVYVAVAVSDQGRGIQADLLPQLFRKFARAPGGDGSGLGLAVCRGIVEAHGGRIWAESDGPGLGARVTFTLPAAAEAAPPAPAPAIPASPPAARRQVRVLAVDDDPQALRYVRDALTSAGYAPIVTGDPAEVPRLMEETKPHLALLDLVLPGGDGIELMHHIRKTADVPVIFLSVYGHDATVARALDMGAADYVVKPFAPTELAARIRAALRKRLAPESGEPAAPYAAAGLRIDYAERRVLVDAAPVDLTATEYAVLYELAVRAPRVLTHTLLLQRVWGPERVGEPWLVRDVVKRLRRKLGDAAATPTYIFTEPRVGYRLAAPGEAAPTEPRTIS